MSRGMWVCPTVGVGMPRRWGSGYVQSRVVMSRGGSGYVQGVGKSRREWVCPGVSLPWHLSHDACDVTYSPHPWTEQWTETCENITFPELRWLEVIRRIEIYKSSCKGFIQGMAICREMFCILSY